MVFFWVYNKVLCEQEIHALKTQVEAAKYEVIKYGIGKIISKYILFYFV
jgi:hypothetical protein